MKSDQELKSVLNKFTEAKDYQISPFGNGHINETFLARHIDKSNSDLVLQKINHEIFRDIEGLMNNIILVTDHIKGKLMNNNCNDPHKKVLSFNLSKDGKYFYKDQSGDFWRCCNYIERSVTYEIIENESIAFKAGQIIGQFMNHLSDFDAGKLTETIPKFHDLEWRWENFKSSLHRDAVQRSEEIKSEIKFAEEKYPELVQITRFLKSGKLPIRVTHNDTKLNNILFSEDNDALCLIDLDTVMPGSLLHDFGDAIRTSCNTANEDEQDLTKISLNLSNFKQFSQGFIEATSGFIKESEKNLLVISTKFMAFIMGLRFLTDYIDGDIYYKTDYKEHNLVRCRAQFKLLTCIQENQSYMEQIVKDC